MENGDPLVSADWLKDNINSPDIRVVDATFFIPYLNPPETGYEAYHRAHIPGAVYFDIGEVADPGSPFAYTLPGPVLFSSKVRKLGLGDGNRIIVYDQNNFFASARAWWMFRVMGHTDIKVLDGGLAAWIDAGGEIEDLPPVAVERHFTPRVRADLIATTDNVAGICDDDSVALLDARPEPRFCGDIPDIREGYPSGHIPGSVNVPCSKLMTLDGKMRTRAELEKAFDDASAQTVVTCGSGISAAVTALALARLGNWDAAVYDGSWTEWASDPSRPVITGDAD